MARAALRMLQLCPGLGDEWSLAPIHSLLLQSDADVRWAGVECMAIMTKMVRPHCQCRSCSAFLPLPSIGEFIAVKKHG